MVIILQIRKIRINGSIKIFLIYYNLIIIIRERKKILYKDPRSKNVKLSYDEGSTKSNVNVTLMFNLEFFTLQ